MIDKEEEIDLINRALRNGFGKDWYSRADIQKVHLITDDEIPIVVLDVYYAEHETVYLMSAPLQEFSEILEDNIKNCSKKKFIPVWQGGYSGNMPDGGDVVYQCNVCEVGCIER